MESGASPVTRSASSVQPGAAAGGGLGPSEKAQHYLHRVQAFVREHVLPNEHVLEAHSVSDKKWTIHPLVEEMKAKAKAQGLWNLWIPSMVGTLAKMVGTAARPLSPAFLSLSFCPPLSTFSHSPSPCPSSLFLPLSALPNAPPQHTAHNASSIRETLASSLPHDQSCLTFCLAVLWSPYPSSLHHPLHPLSPFPST